MACSSMSIIFYLLNKFKYPRDRLFKSVERSNSQENIYYNFKVIRVQIKAGYFEPVYWYTNL